MKWICAVAIVYAAMMTGCSGDDDNAGDSSSASGWQSELGCTNTAEEETEELYVLALYTCTKSDGSKTAVYTFKDSTARDNWQQVAEEVGAVVLTTGDTWLEMKQ
jgi:hypothetical protein